MGTEKKKAIAGAGGWMLGKAADKLVENWQPLLVSLFGSGGMTYLASISNWLRPYGPVAWGMVALLTLIGFALIFMAYAWGRHRLTMANLLTIKASTSKGNILAPAHEYEYLDLGEFYLPGVMSVSNKRFEHCHLLGPLSVVLAEHCTIAHCGFVDCDVVVVDEGAGLSNVLVFKDVNILHSRIQNVTFVMGAAQWKLTSGLHSLPVIAGRQLVGLT